MADNIGAYVTSAVAIIGVIVALYKLSRIEQPHSDADLASKYRNMAVEAAGNETTMKHRIDELEQRIDDLETSWAEAEQHIMRLDEYIDELVTVMRNHGMQPLKVRPSRKAKATV